MNKQEALARTDKLRSVLERIPDGIEWLYPSLEGFTVSGKNPSILLTADGEFSSLVDYFNAQPTRHDKYPSPDWYVMAFEVDGVTLYNMYKKDKREDNEHDEQGSGNRESSGGLPDGESPEENRVERGHSGSGHQTDGEYPS